MHDSKDIPERKHRDVYRSCEVLEVSLRKEKRRKIFTIFEKYLKFLERVEKGVRSWIIDYPAMLSTWPAIEQRVDRPSSPCVAYFHYVRLCQAGVRKGGGAKKGNNAVRRHLSPSPCFSAPLLSLSPPLRIFHRLISLSVVRVSATRAPHTPLFFLSPSAYSKCFPSSLPFCLQVSAVRFPSLVLLLLLA